MLIRRAVAADRDALLALERTVALAPHWSEVVWMEVLQAEGRGVWVAELEGELAGFVVGSDVAGVVEMESLGVSEGARRQGVGHALVEALKSWSLERGAQSMELEVRESNAVALGFYRAHGFGEQGRRQRYYSDPVEDAVLMTTAI